MLDNRPCCVGSSQYLFVNVVRGFIDAESRLRLKPQNHNFTTNSGLSVLRLGRFTLVVVGCSTGMYDL
jgi:hypothetical protein